MQEFKLTQKQEDQYIIICHALAQTEDFTKQKVFKLLPSDLRKRFNTAITHLDYFREHLPLSLELSSCKRLDDKVKSNKIEMKYIGSDSVTLKKEEVRDLLEFTVDKYCVGCNKNAAEIKGCKFRKKWWRLLDENDVNSRSCECKFSCERVG